MVDGNLLNDVNVVSMQASNDLASRVSANFNFTSIQSFFFGLINAYIVLLSDFKLFGVVVLIGLFLGWAGNNYVFRLPQVLWFFIGLIISLLLFPFYFVLIQGLIGG